MSKIESIQGKKGSNSKRGYYVVCLVDHLNWHDNIHTRKSYCTLQYSVVSNITSTFKVSKPKKRTPRGKDREGVPSIWACPDRGQCGRATKQ